VYARDPIRVDADVFARGGTEGELERSQA
jgi:hypothetical protein